MNADGSLCTGCGRTSQEIRDWPAYDGARKLEVFQELPGRRKETGYGVPILGHPMAVLDRVILGALDDPKAQWAIGLPGAAAEFNGGDGALLQARLWEYGGEVRGGLGGVRVVLDHGAQKIKIIGEPDGNGMVSRLHLCLYTRKAAMSGRRTLTEIGPDVEALRTGDRQGILFDLGLALPFIDYCVRVDDPDLVRRLRGLAGRAVVGGDGSILEILAAASPHRVLLTRMGRVEVWSPIPAPGMAPPEGPHSHLDPTQLGAPLGAVIDPLVPDTLYPVFSLTLSDPIPEVAPPVKVAAQ
jgi:hypothetical protein